MNFASAERGSDVLRLESTSPPYPRVRVGAIRRHLTHPALRVLGSVLGEAGGLSDFGVNLMTLPPGSWSSQRHWHSDEDEFVYLLEGAVMLIEDGGETVLHAGDCATFPKGTGNGHHLINKSSAMAVYLEGLALPLGWTIHDAGDRERYLYFITAGIVSRFYVTANRGVEPKSRSRATKA